MAHQVLPRQPGAVVLDFLVLVIDPESQEQMEVPRQLAAVAEQQSLVPYQSKVQVLVVALAFKTERVQVQLADQPSLGAPVVAAVAGPIMA